MVQSLSLKLKVCLLPAQLFGKLLPLLCRVYGLFETILPISIAGVLLLMQPFQQCSLLVQASLSANARDVRQGLGMGSWSYP